MSRLPDFVIAGALRSGTTSLARYLGSHPEIFMTPRKELHFFDNQFERGLDWYASYFDEAAPGQLTAEATPAYMAKPDALLRMAAHIPEAKLLFNLREPVGRMWSHYWMRAERGLELRKFSVAVDEEIKVYEAEGPESPKLEYLRNSLYGHHLGNVLHHFPSSQVGVFLFERMIEDPVEEYRKVCRFLGVDDSFVPDNAGKAINAYVEFRWMHLRRQTKKLQPGLLKRVLERLNTKTNVKYEKIDRGLRRSLTDFFAPSNAEVERIMDSPIPEWRS